MRSRLQSSRLPSSRLPSEQVLLAARDHPVTEHPIKGNPVKGLPARGQPVRSKQSEPYQTGGGDFAGTSQSLSGPQQTPGTGEELPLQFFPGRAEQHGCGINPNNNADAAHPKSCPEIMNERARFKIAMERFEKQAKADMLRIKMAWSERYEKLQSNNRKLKETVLELRSQLQERSVPLQLSGHAREEDGVSASAHESSEHHGGDRSKDAKSAKEQLANNDMVDGLIDQEATVSQVSIHSVQLTLKRREEQLRTLIHQYNRLGEAYAKLQTVVKELKAEDNALRKQHFNIRELTTSADTENTAVESRGKPTEGEAWSNSGHVAVLNEKINLLESALQERETTLQDREAALQKKEEMLLEKDGVIREKEAALQDKQEEISHLISEVQRLASRAVPASTGSAGVGCSPAGAKTRNRDEEASYRLERCRLEANSLRELTYAAMLKVLGWAISVGIYDDRQTLSRLHLKPSTRGVTEATPPGSGSSDGNTGGVTGTFARSYFFELRLESVYSPPEDPGCIIAHCPLELLVDRVRDRRVQTFLTKRYNVGENRAVGENLVVDTQAVSAPGPAAADPWIEELYDLSAEGVRMKLVGRYGTLWRRGGVWQDVFGVRRKLAPLIAAISIHELSSSFRLQGRNTPKDRLLETHLKDAAKTLTNGGDGHNAA